MIELHHVSIGQQISNLSVTVEDGSLLCISGRKGSGKSTLLRAILGLIAIDGGHISIDGELLTPLSAPYFRRQMAYVPQQLELMDGYDGMADVSEMLFELHVNKGETAYRLPSDNRSWKELTADEHYLLLLSNTIQLAKPVLIVDEPAQPLQETTAETVDNMLRDALQRGTTVVAVNSRITENRIEL